MSQIYIRYKDLEDSVSASEKARKEIDQYIKEIDKSIKNKISDLPGSDPKGYTNTAWRLAAAKAKKLEEHRSSLSNYERTANDFISAAKRTDKDVSSQMKMICSNYVGKQGLLRRIGNGLYNFFCVDIPNKFTVIRKVMDFTKKAWSWVGDHIIEPVYNWFKYGDGKYIWNIAMAVVGTIAAVAGAIAAIAAIPFTGGLSISLVIACVGALAASVGAVITAVNSVSKIKSNAKALSLSGNIFNGYDGDPGAARYYGNISTLHQEWSKTDMGDADTNAKYEHWGNVIDTTKTVADITAVVCSFAKLGNVYDYRYKDVNQHIKGYDLHWSNIKRNIMHDMGFKVSGDHGLKVNHKTGGYEGFNFKKGLFAGSENSGKYTLHLKNGDWKLPEGMVKVIRGGKATKNVMDFAENIDALHDYSRKSDPSFGDTMSAGGEAIDAASNMKFFGPLKDYVKKPITTATDTWEAAHTEPAVDSNGVPNSYDTAVEGYSNTDTSSVIMSSGGGGGGSFGFGGSGGGGGGGGGTGFGPAFPAQQIIKPGMTGPLINPTSQYVPGAGQNVITPAGLAAREVFTQTTCPGYGPQSPSLGQTVLDAAANARLGPVFENTNYVNGASRSAIDVIKRIEAIEPELNVANADWTSGAEAINGYIRRKQYWQEPINPGSPYPIYRM